MSAQSNQKIKRNGSPSTSRHGPMRATKQFGLGMVNASSNGTRKPSSRRTPTSPTSSKTKGQSLSETGFVAERRSPTSPSFKVEKPKALHAGHSGSLESISYYLSGQWPKDAGLHQTKSRNSETISSKPPVSLNQNLQNPSLFKKDQQTQTPEEWEDHEKSKHLQAKMSYKRVKSVVSSSDQRNLKSKEIKQKLRGSQTITRYSPVQILHGSSQPIRIPTPTNSTSFQLRGTPGKQRASAEGHNPEIEKLIIAATSKYADDDSNSSQMITEDVSDGRRAPVLDLLRTCSVDVDTQTPSQFLHPITPTGISNHSDITNQLDELYSQSNTRCDSRASTDTDQENSRPQSISPVYIIPGSSDFDDLIGGLRIESPVQQTATIPASPKPNNEFVRSPPDGAERVKLDELQTAPRLKNFLTPIMNSAGFQPSERSAFQSLHSPTGTTATN